MGLDPPYLADRRVHLDRFQRYLAGFPTLPRNVRLTGLRGVGKTVLLQHFARVAEENDWAVVSREWTEHLQDERTFALAFVDDCRQAVEQASRSVARRSAVRSTLSRALDLLGSITVSLAGITVSVRPADRDRGAAPAEIRLYAALRSCCVAVTAARRRGLVVLYDEAHVVRDSSTAGSYPLGTLLAVVARAQRESVPVMLVLCGLPTLTENLARARSYTERMFQAERLDRLRPPEDVLAFTQPLRNADRVYDPGLERILVQDTHGYPFFVQYLGALLWEATDWPTALTVEDYQRLRPTFLEGLDRSFFDARLARTSSFERRLMSSIAEVGEAAPLRQVVTRLGISNGAAQAAILRLVDKGLIYRPERGVVAFAVPLFGEYLRRTTWGCSERPSG
jgi:hypothetical protein